jgi:undecaprenyl-phosphate 4-deoxy-4-formamido-L-arabinose transferase
MSTVGIKTGVSVVVPVYSGAEAIEAIVERSIAALRAKGALGEVILVDDASTSPTCEIARQIAQTTGNVRLVRFARNEGQHAALLAGVREARYSTVVTVDDDLQNPPEEIPQLLARLEKGDVDVVYGYTPQSSHSRFRRAASIGVRWAVSRATGLESLQYLGSFRAFHTELRGGFAGAVGPGVSLDVLLGWSTQRFGHVEVHHDVRAAGESGYTLRKLVRFGFDTLTGYSTSLLNVVTALGLASVALGLGILTWVLGRYLIAGASVVGFPFLASSIALFSGAQMLSLGIIGQYLGRIHMRVQGRPSYHIAERVSADSAAPTEDDVT